MLAVTFHIRRSGAATTVVAAVASAAATAAPPSRRRRAAAFADVTAITITVAVTTSRMRSQRQRRPHMASGRRRRQAVLGVGLSRSKDELTALIVQGYSISSDSAVDAGQTVEKNAGRMRAAFIEKVQRTRAPLTLIEFSVAVWCYSRATAAPRRSVGRCTRLC
jgi:phage FluMu gp28-like protein